MKKNFWKVLAMAIVAVMMVSTVAFADVAVEAPDATAQVVTATLTGLTDGEEATILAVDAGTALANADNDTIVYIDQTTISGDSVTFTFDATAAAEDPYYDKYVDVYCGYTSMAAEPVSDTGVLVYASTMSVAPAEGEAIVVPVDNQADAAAINAYIASNIVVSLAKADGTSATVAEGYTVAAADGTATVTYGKDNEKTATIAYTLEEAAEATVVSISLDKDVYTRTANLSYTTTVVEVDEVAANAVITANMSDGSTQVIPAADCTFSAEEVFNNNGTEDVLTDDYYDTVVTVKYGDFSDTANFVYYGDVSKDGKINAKDRQFIARFVAKWPDMVVNKANADVAGPDNKVNAKDRQYLARYVAKWATEGNDYSILPKE